MKLDKDKLIDTFCEYLKDITKGEWKLDLNNYQAFGVKDILKTVINDLERKEIDEKYEVEKLLNW